MPAAYSRPLTRARIETRDRPAPAQRIESPSHEGADRNNNGVAGSPMMDSRPLTRARIETIGRSAN